MSLERLVGSIRTGGPFVGAFVEFVRLTILLEDRPADHHKEQKDSDRVYITRNHDLVGSTRECIQVFRRGVQHAD